MADWRTKYNVDNNENEVDKPRETTSDWRTKYNKQPTEESTIKTDTKNPDWRTKYNTNNKTTPSFNIQNVSESPYSIFTPDAQTLQDFTAKATSINTAKQEQKQYVDKRKTQLEDIEKQLDKL